MKNRHKVKETQAQQLKMSQPEPKNPGYGLVILNKDKFVEVLDEAQASKAFALLKSRMSEVKQVIANPKSDTVGIVNIDANGGTVSMRKDVMLSDIDQILEAQTIERAHYYLRRLRMGINEIKTGKLNEINLRRWKEYDEVLTDSLWVLQKRDNSGAHVAEYWGNFIPQIPRQMMVRYTKKGDWVLDAFAGSGTTLIECRRLGRNGIGIELNSRVAQRARELIEQEQNKGNVTTGIAVGDNRTIDIKTVLARHNVDRVQLLMMHPPYHDIIKFSEDTHDLSNAKTTQDFLNMFGQSVENATPYLEKGRFLALVIGDKYSKGEWIPLGFLCMNEVLKRGYLLKAIIVKNFEETRGKRNQQELWRYRALVGGFYVFKHEYVMVFKKK
jgi:16S rRNA G966 N2-methylase RsmD/mannose/fructose/N-acetylgalactosamine-specific phosphotransferase system component IIB